MTCSRIIIILCVILQVNADSASQISLNFKSDTVNGTSYLNCVNSTKHVLREADDTQMVIIKSNYIEKHDCYTSKDEKQKLNTKSFSNRGEKMYVTEVTSPTEAKYICYFLVNNGNVIEPLYTDTDGETYTKVVCEFEIALKYWKSLKVYINGKYLDSTSGSFTSVVDYEYVYHYVTNEFVNVECKKPDVNGTMEFKYVSLHCNSSTAESVDSVGFQTVLKPHHNNNFVDCKFLHNNVETVVRVRMIHKTDPVKNVFKVNNLYLTRWNGTNFVYHYNERPKVYCGDALAQISNEKITSAGTNFTANCNFESGNKVLKLMKDVPCNGIYVFGLSDRNILFQTCHSSMQHRVIYYEYTDNEIINLSCIQAPERLKWIVPDNGAKKTTPSHLFQRQMRREDNSLRISCRNDNRETSIRFQYVENPKPTTEAVVTTEPGNHDIEIAKVTLKENSTSGNYDIESTTHVSNATETPTPGSDFMKEHGIRVGGTVLAIVFLLLLICLLIIFRRRRRQVSEFETTYANFKEIGQAQSARRQNENIYSNQRTTQVAEYAVPADVKEENTTYSEPYKPTLEDLYSKPTPKNERTKEEIKYAEIGFQSNISNKAKPTRKPQDNSECVYSEVLPNQDLYAKVRKGNEYGNKFDSTYANANGGEYTEPACSQVGVKRN